MAMDSRALVPGTLIHNRYRILKVLGAGGFGVTYKVMDQKENTVAAMKEYMPLDAAYRPAGSVEVRAVSEAKRVQYEKFRQRFLEEAQTIYKFRGHPNIVEVKHLFYENNTAYYVMEYVDGMDLKQFLSKNGEKISWQMLAPIMAQVVSGLKPVHNAGMIHCDISPDNIFLVNAGQVKLLDFGAARSTLRGSIETSTIVAKPGYSPYEQMRASNMGPWTDVYALAVTIYRCITGEMVRDSNERINQDNTIWPSQMGVAIPSAQWEIALKKGLALRVEDRYQNVVDFWNDLNAGGFTTPVYSYAAGTMDNSSTYQAQPSGGYTSGGYPVLEGVQGVYAGKQIAVTSQFQMGVDPSQCGITFPPGTPGISRRHLRVWSANGKILIMDLGSTYGSWLSGRKMTAGLVYELLPGATVYLGGGQVFRAM